MEIILSDKTASLNQSSQPNSFSFNQTPAIQKEEIEHSFTVYSSPSNCKNGKTRAIFTKGSDEDKKGFMLNELDSVKKTLDYENTNVLISDYENSLRGNSESYFQPSSKNYHNIQRPDILKLR
jgi:hypothetical protein